MPSRANIISRSALEAILSHLIYVDNCESDWEEGEYKWLESHKKMTIEEKESGLSKKWFEFDEERQEHQELEHFMKELRICDTGGGHLDYMTGERTISSPHHCQ